METLQERRQQPRIHPTAILHESAQIAPGVDIGPYAVIGEEVILRAGTRVGPNAVVEFADVGEGCEIHAGAFVGTAPQDLKYRGERTQLILGPRCIVRECVTLNRGTAASGVTRIGARCLFMAYSHVAHDCVIGSDVIVANSVAIAGHVEVQDMAVIGGMVGLHQFVRVGKLAMIGAGAMVPLDIPPFTMAWGDRARLRGLNLVGLKRRGYSPEDIAALKKAYRLLFHTGLPLKQALEKLTTQHPAAGPVQELMQFIYSTNRGICRPRHRSSPREGED